MSEFNARGPGAIAHGVREMEPHCPGFPEFSLLEFCIFHSVTMIDHDRKPPRFQ